MKTTLSEQLAGNGAAQCPQTRPEGLTRPLHTVMQSEASLWARLTVEVWRNGSDFGTFGVVEL